MKPTFIVPLSTLLERMDVHFLIIIWNKVEYVNTLVDKIPFTGVDGLAKINKKYDAWEFLASVYSIISFKRRTLWPMSLPLMKPV